MLLLALFLLGHARLALLLTSRGIFLLPDGWPKNVLLALNAGLWGTLAVQSTQSVGWRGFGEALLAGAGHPHPALRLWQGVACALGAHWLLLSAWARLRDRPPAEQIGHHRHLHHLDRQALQTRWARFSARAGFGALHVHEMTLRLPRFPRALSGLRLAHLSDLHCGREMPAALAWAAVAECRQARPDLILVTGDFIGPEGTAEHAAELTAALKAPLGTYAVLGNHDFWHGPQALAECLAQRGVVVLRNRGVRITREGELACGGSAANPTSAGFWLAGVDDYWSRKADLQAALAGRGEGEFCLLLAHNPDHVVAAAGCGVDLQLSGHTHGGQVVPPLLGPVLTPSRYGTRFSHGLRKLGGTVVHISRGIAGGPPLRLGSPPDISFLTLESGGEARE